MATDEQPRAESVGQICVTPGKMLTVELREPNLALLRALQKLQ